jgi:hypothetical protein
VDRRAGRSLGQDERRRGGVAMTAPARQTSPKQVARCQGTKTCRAHPGKSGYCAMHDPARAEERTAARRAGGWARHTPHSSAAKPPATIRTLTDVLALLDYATAEATVMENSVIRGRLLVQLAGAYTEVIKTGALEERLAAIEAKLGEKL